MVRVGLRWLDPAEANDLKRQVRQLTDEALRLLEVGQDEAAIDKCVQASELDRDAILADFLLGLGYALVSCDAKGTNRHFGECVRRDPRHVSALNNLAAQRGQAGKVYSGIGTLAGSTRSGSRGTGSHSEPWATAPLGESRTCSSADWSSTPVQRPLRRGCCFGRCERVRQPGWLALHGIHAPLGEPSVSGKDAKK